MQVAQEQKQEEGPVNNLTSRKEEQAGSACGAQGSSTREKAGRGLCK